MNYTIREKNEADIKVVSERLMDVFGNTKLQILAIRNAITSIVKTTSLTSFPYGSFCL